MGKEEIQAKAEEFSIQVYSFILNPECQTNRAFKKNVNNCNSYIRHS